MTVQRHYETITVTASQDLTGHQYKAVGLHGGVGATTLLSAGILMNKPAAGDHATLAYAGQVKAYAGAAINSNAQVGVTASGFLISVATSDYVGFAKTSAASGDLFELICNFASRAD